MKESLSVLLSQYTDFHSQPGEDQDHVMVHSTVSQLPAVRLRNGSTSGNQGPVLGVCELLCPHPILPLGFWLGRHPIACANLFVCSCLRTSFLWPIAPWKECPGNTVTSSLSLNMVALQDMLYCFCELLCQHRP